MSDTDLGLGPLVPPDVLSPAAALRPDLAAKAGGPAAVRKVARDFEAVLLHRVFEEMRKTIPESGLLESGTTDQVQSLFWFYLAQDVAEKGGLGLAQDLARQLTRWAADPLPEAGQGVKA